MLLVSPAGFTSTAFRSDWRGLIGALAVAPDLESYALPLPARCEISAMVDKKTVLEVRLEYGKWKKWLTHVRKNGRRGKASYSTY